MKHRLSHFFTYAKLNKVDTLAESKRPYSPRFRGGRRQLGERLLSSLKGAALLYLVTVF
jgi:hypothetical protein